MRQCIITDNEDRKEELFKFIVWPMLRRRTLVQWLKPPEQVVVGHDTTMVEIKHDDGIRCQSPVVLFAVNIRITTHSEA